MWIEFWVWQFLQAIAACQLKDGSLACARTGRSLPAESAPKFALHSKTNMIHELRPDLCDVTVCAVDSLNPRLAARALEISNAHCDFGDVVLFTHEEIATIARIVRTPHIASRQQYSDFVLKQVIQHIRTPWVLLIQWDGYVVDSSAWRAEFLDYDYIGARWRWPWRR
ncbi:DUF5672 family protein [Caballeronia zhejiangensis]|uniref:DUF5672 family protein n=1 Tax=Caballeronia zhejiangensis TaxID=871203 RepID=UPI0011866B3D|nr:DUF5672 family protein [Caballeronia zhejiangensis]